MDWRIRHTIAAMQREIAHPLQLSTLARRVNLSPSRFSHLFRKETGQPPARYLHELRLDSALMLLYDSTLSIKEVMAAVGLNDPSHFTRDFSERNDVSPSAFRERARAGDSGGHAASAADEQQKRPTNSSYRQRFAPSHAADRGYLRNMAR